MARLNLLTVGSEKLTSSEWPVVERMTWPVKIQTRPIVMMVAVFFLVVLNSFRGSKRGYYHEMTSLPLLNDRK